MGKPLEMQYIEEYSSKVIEILAGGNISRYQ